MSDWSAIEGLRSWSVSGESSLLYLADGAPALLDVTITIDDDEYKFQGRLVDNDYEPCVSFENDEMGLRTLAVEGAVYKNGKPLKESAA